jgi:hypothetical protein
MAINQTSELRYWRLVNAELVAMKQPEATIGEFRRHLCDLKAGLVVVAELIIDDRHALAQRRAAKSARR